MVLAAAGGVIVVRTIWADTPRTGEAVTAVESTSAVEPPHGARRQRGRRHVLSASALSAALAVEGETVEPSFFRRTLAFGRLLLVILFICALAGGAIVLVVTTLARVLHSQSG